MDKKDKKDKYFEAVGRRKTSTARVRIWLSAKNSFTINDLNYKDYFKTENQRVLIEEPLKNDEVLAKLNSKITLSAKVSGGGLQSQAEAVRHGFARALVLVDENLRTDLKSDGLLKRDPRAKERRKFGLKKARKAPQWSKR